MHAKFTDDLITGYRPIDDQHREWFNKLDSFWKAARQGKSADEIFDTLIFLQEYIHTHFEDEENLQKEISYPRYIEHKKQHEQFREVIENLVESLQKKGAGFSISVETLNSMLEWAVTHISSMDKDLASFANKKRNKNLAAKH